MKLKISKMPKFWLVIFLLVCPSLSVFANETETVVFSVNIDQETDEFLKAKKLVFDGDWNSARLGLEKYLVDFPDGNYLDEARFWLARSLNKLSQNEILLEKVIVLKEEAASQLDKLIEKYPKSLWLDDAKSLRISIASELELVGKADQKILIDKLLKEIITINNESYSFVLGLLTEMQPEVAEAAIRRIFENEKNAEIRKKTVTLIGKYFHQDLKGLLNRISTIDPDKNVRAEAKYWLDWNIMWNIPTHLIYYGYSVEIKSKAEKNRLPEGKINIYDLPRLQPADKNNVGESLRQFFNNKLENLKFVTKSTIDLYIYGLDMSNNIAGFNFKIVRDGLKKEHDKISGNIRFFDNKSKKEYKKYLTVDDKYEKLVAMRKGDKLALVLFHFEADKETSPIKAEKKLKPIYHSEFSNILGCKVLSSRQSWNAKELTQEGGVTDFGLAKVEISSRDGKWFLIGDLIVDRKERKFIGRNAELINPIGESVGQGAQIIVPVGNPELFKVIGKK